jgi:DNA-binding NtrC family response regulator
VTTFQDSNHKGSILVIDDEPASLKVLLTILTENGYAVHPANEGELGLQFARHTPPDLILVDVRMPGIDGYGVCQSLKSDPATRAIPVIFVSSIDYAIDKVRAFRSGAVDYVAKPIDAEEVLARIETHISLCRLRNNLESAVRERTAQLVAANARLEAEIVERNHAEAELRKSEAELRRSESYLAEAQRLSLTGSWAWDVRRREYVYWSRELYQFFGFEPEQASLPPFQAVQERFHPEDRPRIAEALEIAVSEKADFKVDFRVVLPDGSIKHAHSVGHSVLGPSGEVVELVGSTMDVTEQRQATMALEIAFDEIKELKDRLYQENLALRDEIDKVSMFEEIVGSSDALQRVLMHVARVAPTDSTVLITGESGTGKELVARAIHKRSHRSRGAFVRVNCAAIPQSLIASELFGHEKGAFTGAMQRRLGRFELANHGTIFLDEVGEIPSETQIILLRVLQERELERVGGSVTVPVDVRVLAATNRDLKAAVIAGTFRLDLYYRLNVFPVRMPSLQERTDDIPVLVEYFIERYASKAGRKIRNIQKRTLDLFKGYHWPGNIRELQNVIERAVILCDGETFAVDETWLRESSKPEGEPVALADMLVDREREAIEAALTESRGRVSGPVGAAAKLGIPRQTLESKIRSLGIDKYRFRSE